MKRKSVVVIALFSLLLLLPFLAHAAPIGKFLIVEGNVDVTPPGKAAIKANMGDEVSEGDTIRTKSKSKCEVTFLDGTVLRLAESTRLRVSEYSQHNEQRNATLNLSRGKIQNIVKNVPGAAAERSKYEVQTPTAVCGVRGTEFFAYYQAGISGAVVTEGTVYAFSTNMPSEVRSIGAGQAMVVTNANTPPSVRPATTGETEQHQKDTKPADKPKSEGKEEENKSETTAAPSGDTAPSGGQQTETKTEEKASDTSSATTTTESAMAAMASFSALDTSSTTLPAPPPVAPPAPEAPIVPPAAGVIPEIKVLSAPSPVTNATTATFSVDTNAASIQYSLDGAAPVSVPVPATGSTISVPNLPEGTHTINVQAVSAGGEVSTPVTYTWTVDTTPPVADITTAVPALTNSSSTSFTVSTTEPVSFLYSTDGVTYKPVTGTTINLTGLAKSSSQTLLKTLNAGSIVTTVNIIGLSDGSHTIYIKALDAAGNVATNAAGTPLVFSFTTSVDTTPPAIALSGTPAPITNATGATIIATATDASAVTLSYKVDSGAATSTAPVLTGLSDGSHTYTVTATDTAGNIATKSYSWTVDTIAPAVTSAAPPSLTKNPPSTVTLSESATIAYTLDGAPGTTTGASLTLPTSDGAHTLTFTATDAAGNTSSSMRYDWIVDTMPPTVTSTTPPSLTKNPPSVVTLSEPVAITYTLDGTPGTTTGASLTLPTSDGAHTLTFTATDAAGNSVTQTYAWTIDTIPPAISLSGTPATITNATGATIVATATDANVVTYSYTVDGGAATSAAPVLTGLSNGSHTYSVTATDAAGNTSSQTYAWAVDTIPPAVTLSGTPATITNATGATIVATATDANVVTYSYTVDGGTATTIAPVLTGLSNGSHTYSVTATDAAGNTSSQTYAWTVDTIPPAITLSGMPAPITNATGATIVATATDANNVTYSYTVDGGATTTTAPVLTGLSEGSHTYTVTATDAAGNTSTQSYPWITDYTAPTGLLTGLPVKVTGSDAAAFVYTVTETHMGTSYYHTGNGLWQAFSGTSAPFASLPEGMNTVYFKAIDLAGNVSSIFSYDWFIGKRQYVLRDALGGTTGGVTGDLGGSIFASSEGIRVISTLPEGSSTGAWLIDMGGTYVIPPTSVNLTAGGKGYGPYLPVDVVPADFNGPPPVPLNGYWLSRITANATGTTITGSSLFTYLSPITLGQGSGGVTGSITSSTGVGSWQAQDLGYVTGFGGTYTEAPLDFSGTVSGGLLFYDPGYLGGALRYANSIPSDRTHNVNGLLGGIGNPWTAPANVTMMGSYSAVAGSEPYLAYGSGWYIDFNDQPVDGYAAVIGGAFKGYNVGLWNGGIIDTKALTLYIAPDGTAGYLGGNLAGQYYSGIGMWELGGIFTKEERGTTGMLPSDLALLVDKGHFGQLFGMSTSSASGMFGAGGTLAATYVEGALLGIPITATDSTSREIGIWNAGLGGSTSGTTGSAMTLKIGSRDFAYDAYSGGGYGGYMTADITSDNFGPTFTGALTGKFITPYIYGDIYGDPITGTGGIYGSFDGTYWQLAGVGRTEGSPLAFASRNTDGLFREYNPDPLHSDKIYSTTFAGSLNYSDGPMAGLIGGTTTLFDGLDGNNAYTPVDLKGMGDYHFAGLPLPLFLAKFGGVGPTPANSLFFGGVNLLATGGAQASLTGNMQGLYWNESGTVEGGGTYELGVLSSVKTEEGVTAPSGVTASLYPGYSMWELDAGNQLRAYSLITGTLPTPGLTSTSIGDVIAPDPHLASPLTEVVAGGSWTEWSRFEEGVTFDDPSRLSVTAEFSGGGYADDTPPQLGGKWTQTWAYEVCPDGCMTYAQKYLVTEITGVDTLNNSNVLDGMAISTTINWDDAAGGWTSVGAGTIKGAFDPATATWRAMALMTGMETSAFMATVDAMTTDAQRDAFTQATKIPAYNVGTTDLRGSGNVTGGTINLGSAVDPSNGILNAAFFAPSTGGKPQIWASGTVSGAYTGAPIGGTVNLKGYQPGSGNPVTPASTNGITASFNIQKWGGTTWGASVTNGIAPANSLTSASGFTQSNLVNFQGGGAGSITPIVGGAPHGTFAGTAAGIVK